MSSYLCNLCNLCDYSFIPLTVRKNEGRKHINKRLVFGGFDDVVLFPYYY